MSQKDILETRLAQLEEEMKEAYSRFFQPGGQERCMRLDKEAMDLCEQIRAMDNKD